MPLQWGCPVDDAAVKSEGPWDLILCADCCYYGEVVGAKHPADPAALVASLEYQAFGTQNSSPSHSQEPPRAEGKTRDAGGSSGGAEEDESKGQGANRGDAQLLSVDAKAASRCVVLVSMEVANSRGSGRARGARESCALLVRWPVAARSL